MCQHCILLTKTRQYDILNRQNIVKNKQRKRIYIGIMFVYAKIEFLGTRSQNINANARGFL